jgi:hypothetical protein
MSSRARPLAQSERAMISFMISLAPP